MVSFPGQVKPSMVLRPVSASPVSQRLASGDNSSSRTQDPMETSKLKVEVQGISWATPLSQR